MAAVTVSELSFHYPDGRQALSEVSFALEQGEKAALLGANGAGKSTLLLHLNGILRGEGQITVCGIELSPKTTDQVRALVGMIFQNPDDQLFSPTIGEDVAFGPYYQGLNEAEIEGRVRSALLAVGLAEHSTRNPFHLSGGEKKRAAIATVLAMQPPVLAFDEPTAGLDPRGRRELAGLLAELPQTMLIATHDLAFARQAAGRAIILDGGRVAADGPVEDLLQDEGLLYRHGLA